MAKLFQPSRGAIYGAPERQAAANIGATIAGIGRSWGNELLQAEYNRQISNAQVASIREWDSFQKKMDESGATPDKWEDMFEEGSQKMREGIMSGVTMPDAKQSVELELNEQMETWKSVVRKRSEIQGAKNVNVDDEVRNDRINENRLYRGELADPDDMFTYLEAGLDNNQAGFDSRVDRLPTLAAKIEADRELTRNIVGDFVVQKLQGMELQEANDFLDQINSYVETLEIGTENIEGKREDLFSPEDIAGLKQRYKSSMTAAKAEAKFESNKLSSEANNEYVQKIAAGDFSEELIQSIAADGRLEPTDKRTLINWMEQRSNALAQDKDDPLTKDDPAIVLDVRSKVYNGIIKTEQQLKSYVGKGISVDTYQKFVAMLPENKDAKSPLTHPSVKRAIADLDAIRDLDVKEFADEEDMDLPAYAERAATYQDKIDTLENQILAKYGSVDDVDPKEVTEMFKELTQPIKEEVVKKWLTGFSGIKKGLSYVWNPTGMVVDLVKGRFAKDSSSQKSPYPEWPDAFLEDGVWKVIQDGKKYRIEE